MTGIFNGILKNFISITMRMLSPQKFIRHYLILFRLKAAFARLCPAGDSVIRRSIQIYFPARLLTRPYTQGGCRQRRRPRQAANFGSGKYPSSEKNELNI